MRKRSDRSHPRIQGCRALRWILLVCLCLGFRVGEVRSQVTPSASPAAPSGELRLTLFAGVAPGDRILIEAGEMGRLEGQLEGILRDTLFLATAVGRAQVPFSSVDRLWVEGRSTWKYARGGAVLGGILGGVVFGAFAPLIHSQDDSGTGEPFTASDEVGAILLGGFLGGLAVGGAGAIVGTAVPCWHLRYQSPAARAPRTPSSPGGPPEARAVSGNRRDDASERSSPAVHPCPGGVGVDLGIHAATGEVHGRTLPYVQLSGVGRVSRRLAIGGEAGLTILGHSVREEGDLPGGGREWSSRRGAVSHVAAIVRTPAGGSSYQRFFTVGVGRYTWLTTRWAGSLGFGAEHSLTGVLKTVRVEARWHLNALKVARKDPLQFVTLTVGVTV